jgi:hypothetical protein
MIAMNGVAACTACDSNMYSLEGGNSTISGGGEVIEQTRCFACPFGANCSMSTSIVLVKPNFWGLISNVSGYPAWTMTKCALGYCCQNASGCNPSFNGSPSANSIVGGSYLDVGGCNVG